MKSMEVLRVSAGQRPKNVFHSSSLGTCGGVRPVSAQTFSASMPPSHSAITQARSGCLWPLPMLQMWPCEKCCWSLGPLGKVCIRHSKDEPCLAKASTSENDATDVYW